ncbi:exosortase A [Tsuneonella dongtanensis]|uniref:exosortase A n=1 Tax=Tsuneonella dongtanensis TaxID=692370 RepID=UPI00083419C2|nr:exosortase A [Tsuneonella dongtanensis]
MALRIAAAWAVLFIVTFPEWRAMAHQWWNIDTYNHVLLVPPILAWLVWLRRDELAQLAPRSWSPGLAWLGAGLLVCLAGRAADINLVAQAGALMAFQGAVLGLVGLRAALVMALPLAYSAFLVPFGDELIPALQHLTARITIALTQLSGIPLLADGLTIDTPGGKFVVAEECSGVKFLVAMIALAVLAGWTGFTRWRPRILLVAGAALVSILANGLRAWGTIYVAQWVGAERAGSFDHIVYGWVFFAIVIVMVLGVAWRYFDREPGEAGFSAAQVEVEPIVRLDQFAMSNAAAMAGIAFLAMAFAALGALV